eukprot:SAG31_NODE_2917_length_4915_cov_1.456603_4_plen_644_part_00
MLGRLHKVTGVFAPVWLSHPSFEQINDHERNARYAAAVESAVAAHGPGARVLDIGCGTGFLALIAARAGAQHVFACEVDSVLAAVAERAVRANNLAHSVTIFACHSSEIQLDAHLGGIPVDLVVHEIFDSTLLGEQVLPSLRDATQRGLLSPGCVSVPAAATVFGQLVHAPTALHARDQLQLSIPAHTLGGDDRTPVSAAIKNAEGCRVGCAARRRLPTVAFPIHGSALLATETPGSCGSHTATFAAHVENANTKAAITPLTAPAELLRFEFSPSLLPPANGRRRLVQLQRLRGRIESMDSKDTGVGHMGHANTAHGLLMWWELELAPTSSPKPAAADALTWQTAISMGETMETVQYTVATCGSCPARLTTSPYVQRCSPREHWWQAAIAFPVPAILSTQLVPVTMEHDDYSMVAELAPTVAAEAPTAARDCGCACVGRWGPDRQAMLADAERTSKYTAAIKRTLSRHLVSTVSVRTSGQNVLLALGAWMGLLCGLDAANHGLDVIIWEASTSGQQYAKALIAAASGSFAGSKVTVANAGLSEIFATFTVSAVVAEPWFSNIGQHWGPGAARQYAALLQSAFAGKPEKQVQVVPNHARLIGCLVECPSLHAAARDVDAGIAGLDLSALNAVRSDDHWQTIRGE